MNGQNQLQTLLQQGYLDAKSKNPGYSLRAFARRLGLNSGAVSSIINGKRRVSKKMAARILERLGLALDVRRKVLESLEFERTGVNVSKLQGVQRSEYLQIAGEQFHLISEWQHFAILSLIRTRDFKSEPKWIAKRLGISLTLAKRSLQRLELLGFIVDQDGRWVRGAPKYSTTDGVADGAIRRAFEQDLQLSVESLHRDPVEKRDFTTITMAVDPRSMAKVKERVRVFQDEVAAIMESGELTEVYKLTVGVFPVGKSVE